MRELIVFVACLILSSSAFAQLDSRGKKLDEMIEEGISDWQIPGLAVVVVKDGDILFKKTYGVKDIETHEPVDENTLFCMASTTKAIVALALGILVDQGKIQWDDKVRDHLPEFELSDPYITADSRVKDLLTHNLGIGGNTNLLFLIDSVSTTATIEKFRLAKKTYPLRGGFTYQNIMYVIAGELIEEVSGQHWTSFVANSIFKPLEMNRTQSSSNSLLKVGNYVFCHIDDLEDGLVKIVYPFSVQTGAAGGIWSTTSDISNYLKFIVNDGIFNKDTLIQPATFQYLFEPHAVISQDFYPTQQLTKPNWMTYGLGWFQQDYRGSKLDFHTGSKPGLVAIAGIMHEHDFAVYVFANLDQAELRHAIMYKAMDLFIFNDDSRDWHQEIFKLYSGLRDKAIETRKKRDEDRILGTSPSLTLDQYSGIYKHEMLGEIYVSVVDGQLHIDSNNYLYYKTEHWHYDTFITNKDPKLRERFLIYFNLNQTAKIEDLEFRGEKFLKTELPGEE